MAAECRSVWPLVWWGGHNLGPAPCPGNTSRPSSAHRCHMSWCTEGTWSQKHRIKHVCFAVILIYLHFESLFHTRRLSVDSPQTRGWCTIWSMASRSRCSLLQASRSPHMPPHRRSGTFLRWCRRIERSSVSHHDHRLCCTAVKGKIFVALLTLKRDFVHLKFLRKALQIFHKK